MNINLDKDAIKELFKEYATPALKSEIRREVRQEIDKIVKQEVGKKVRDFSVSLYTIKDEIRKEIRSTMNHNNIWDKEKPIEVMRTIMIDEFKAKAKRVNMESIEVLIVQEAREMIKEKMDALANILAMLDKNNSKKSSSKKYISEHEIKKNIGGLF